jgi:hypothetical protein
MCRNRVSRTLVIQRLYGVWGFVWGLGVVCERVWGLGVVCEHVCGLGGVYERVRGLMYVLK